MSSGSTDVRDNKHANWVFTYHYGGPTQLPLSEVEVMLECLSEKCVFYIFGKERCPTTDQLHIQGYCEFKVPQRRTALVRLLQCTWAAAKGSADANIEYCSKEGDFSRGGTPRNTNSSRSVGSSTGGEANAERWKRARRELETGERLSDDQIYIQHHAAVMSIRREFMTPVAALMWENNRTPNVWMYGKTGCGKSRKAREDAPNSYFKLCNKWWDGHRDEETVIIDDFDKAHAVLCHHLKIWGDRYPFIAEVKGGAMLKRPQKIIITSNWHPSEIWSSPQDLEPILRRFNVVNMSPLDGAFVPRAELITASSSREEELLAVYNQPKDSAQVLDLCESEDEEEVSVVEVPTAKKPSKGESLCHGCQHNPCLCGGSEFVMPVRHYRTVEE